MSRTFAFQLEEGAHPILAQQPQWLWWNRLILDVCIRGRFGKLYKGSNSKWERSHQKHFPKYNKQTTNQSVRASKQPQAQQRNSSPSSTPTYNHAIFRTNLHTSEVLKRHRATSERAIAGRVACEAAITECAIPRISIAAIVGTLAEWAECGGNAWKRKMNVREKRLFWGQSYGLKWDI